MNNLLNISINGVNFQGAKGETVLEIARRNNIEIPTLCHDPRLEPFTSCYLCVVEIEGMRGLQPSCSTRAADGMKIITINDKIKKARKTALDLLLSNHYADCTAPCKQTCPAGVDVQGYISLIEKGQYSAAVELIKETNPLPAICGRVCVRPCEVACRRNLLDEGAPVGIDYLKRFASDFDLQSKNKYRPKIQPETNRKICVIGAGPAGLSAAFFLRKLGHTVDIFESAPYAGGWLRYGIPEYRLPNDLLQKEVDNIAEMGVSIFYNQKLGDNLKFAELNKKYDAFILAIGSQAGTSIGCEGDDAVNVFSGVDFLRKMELSGEKMNFAGKTVGVIGGGNTAMDCCRTSIRLGAKKVYVIYRRTEKEMPANPIEIHESKLEGVEYLFLTAPVSVNKNTDGTLKSIRCVKMELGEPDASGRRKPVVVQNSDFDIELDYALAAIGQKTIINFLSEINENSTKGELKANKWGDIDANAKTLQTGIENMFAAGDGVTGPATLIQAIAQAKIASESCHQYLSGQPLTKNNNEFISKKDNFKIQQKSDYSGFFIKQHRHEMPVLKPNLRMNFDEVELGYENDEIAKKEAQRCLECGCNEYFNCDLKKYATEYGVEQNKYKGEFQEFKVDFRHPYIEIDNNKCILCSRCVRICSEINGANALGLVKRGFKTYVAPTMGNSLSETKCESCGLCISTCPTGAITENFKHKPGPVKLEKFETICNYCSIGCTISVFHKNGFVMKIEGAEGLVNKNGNICKYAKFGYNYLNDNNRITKPLLRKNGKFTEITFTEAFEILVNRMKSVKADENIFFAGARLTNEELYLIQKIARAGVGTNNIGNFQYLGRGDGYLHTSFKNMPLSDIHLASKIYLLGSEINIDNAVVGYMVQETKTTKNIEVENITTLKNSFVKHKATKTNVVSDYYYFIKAVNHYLLSNNLQNNLFINDNCDEFEEYRLLVLAESFEELAQKATNNTNYIKEFAEDFNNQLNAVLIVSEKEISGSTLYEIFNLMLITGKIGKTGMGLVTLKEKNNSQGITDMGICPIIGVGGVNIENVELNHKMQEIWKLKKNPLFFENNLLLDIQLGNIKNMFIFGENPLGTAKEKIAMNKMLKKADFIAVQDYFITETGLMADLIIPASLPFEIGGTFTNTQKFVQNIEKVDIYNNKTEKSSIEQFIQILHLLNYSNLNSIDDVMSEIRLMLPTETERKYRFVTTIEDSSKTMFEAGADDIVQRFNNEFENNFKKK